MKILGEVVVQAIPYFPLQDCNIIHLYRDEESKEGTKENNYCSWRNV